MIIHNAVDQNDHAWEELRKGVLTASKVGEWLIAEPKVNLTKPEIIKILKEADIPHKTAMKVGELGDLLPDREQYLEIPKGAQSAKHAMMCALMGEKLATSFVDPWTGNGYTDYGHEMEQEACDSFAMETGMELQKVGFCIADSGPFGCSPDRLIYRGDDPIGVLEVKCKSPKVHVETVIAGVLPFEHAMQVHFQLAVTDLPVAYFYSYSPDMQPLMIEVKPNALTARVRAGMQAFERDYKEFQNQHLGKVQL